MRTCSVEGCERKHRAKGLCEAHYTRYKRGRSMDAPVKCHEHRHADLCQVRGCNRPYRSKGYCHLHYSRAKRGAPLRASVQPRTFHHSYICSVPGCDRPYKAKGLCNVHYMRQRNGKTVTVLPEWARPVATRQKCDCGNPAIAECTAGVGAPIITTRKAPVDIVMCEECLQSERYVRGEIDFRELQALRVTNTVAPLC